MRSKKFRLRRQIEIKPQRNVKNKIIYVRMEDENVEKIDRLKRNLDVATRSQMIRDLVVEALRNVRI